MQSFDMCTSKFTLHVVSLCVFLPLRSPQMAPPNGEGRQSFCQLSVTSVPKKTAHSLWSAVG